MELASALLGPVCERLINTAFEEYELTRNAKEEIKNLKSTVSIIKGVLRDAEEKKVKDSAVGAWLRALKQILLDAEDVLDEAATMAALQTRDAAVPTTSSRVTKVRNILCCLGSIDKVRASNNIAHQIKAIGVELDRISKDKDRLGLQELSATNNFLLETNRSVIRRRETSSMLADDVIGRDDEKMSIIELLLGPKGGNEGSSRKNNVHVISIVGMGGSGKTTLAKLVFNDPKVKGHFEPMMMWVCVSEDFDLRRITKEITKPDVWEEGSSLETIQKELRNKVEGKRFLLVLDDVWEEDPSRWEKLYEPLSYGGEGSKIIVTTRSQKVSRIAESESISLKTLSTEDMWLIFKRYALDGYDSYEHTQLQIVGRQVVEKLKGSPLAAKTVGRLLNANPDVGYWKRVLKREINMLPKSDDIMSTLRLSYNHLQGHLKQCFAYCSLFPKDYMFSKDELVHLWMAQNVVQLPREPDAESIGSEYFDDLQYKSFFEQNRFGRSSCVMHDLLHDLAELISGDDCFRLEDGKMRGLCEHGKMQISETVQQS